MRLFSECTVVHHAAFAVGVLQDRPKAGFLKSETLIITRYDLDTGMAHARTEHGQRLGEELFIQEEGLHILLHLFTAAQPIHHGSGLGGGSSLVEQ